MVTCIRNIPEDYQLVTDSQDVKAVLESMGQPDLYEDYQGLFVKVGDGEYESVYAFCGIVPYLSKLATKIL
jgi:hypothetical protein